MTELWSQEDYPSSRISARSLVAEVEALRREVERLRVLSSREAGGLLEAILHHSPHGIVVCDAKGKLTLHNRAAERIWAGSATAADTSDWSKYRAFHPDGRPYEPDDFSMVRCLRAGETVPPEEVRIQRFDGTFGVVLGSCAPILGPGGDVRGALAVFADITELTELATAQRLARERIVKLQAVTEALSDARLPADVARVVSRQIAAVLAADRGIIAVPSSDGAELIVLGQTGLDPANHVVRFSVDAPLPLAEAFRNAKPVWLSSPDDYPIRFPRGPSAGALSTVSRACIPLIARGNKLGVVGFDFSQPHLFEADEQALIQDLARRTASAFERTQLYETESAARRQAELLFHLAQSTASAEGLDDTYRRVLAGVVEVMEVDRAAFCLFDDDGVMRFKAWRGLSDRYRRTVEGQTPWSPDETNPVPIFVDDARRDSSLARCVPVFEKEGIRALGFVPLIHDRKLLGKFMVYCNEPRAFTERDRKLSMTLASHIAQAVARARLVEKERLAARKLEILFEQAQLANRARDDMLAVVSHELKNPLAAIVISASSALKLELNDKKGNLRKRLVTIYRSAEQMSRLIGDLVDLASIQSGRLTIQRAVLDAKTVVEAAADEFISVAEERGIRLETIGAPDVGRVEGDRARLIQALANLLSNAVNVTAKGGAVHIGVERRGGEIVYFVRDTGPGIQPDELPHIFEKYWRSKRTPYRGTGLGLAIAKGIADAHRGLIWAESTLGRGSTFFIALPAQPARKR
jgi:PAS domain S-box-containing protein